jgi:hypothetical protein
MYTDCQQRKICHLPEAKKKKETNLNKKQTKSQYLHTFLNAHLSKHISK